MPYGDIVSKGPPKPEMRLPLGMGAMQPFFQFMMDTATETLAVTKAYREAQEETNRLLGEILEKLGEKDAPKVD